MAELPDCGIYRTGVSLPGHEEEVSGGVLIYFHNHSEQGPPLVLTPHDNTQNRWSFHERGWLVEDPGFISALIPLKKEGYYTVSGHHLHVSKEELIPERTLVQLGYNRRGDTLLFVAEFEGNTIKFPSQGFRFESPEVQGNLASAVFSVPESEDERTLH
jgi:hypothetical protein